MQSKIWIISDTHFLHRNIIKYCSRPYADEYQMNAEITRKWNEKVKPNDVVYHLGDVFHGLKGRVALARKIIGSLNGEKHLVLGNHDQDNLPEETFLDYGFKSVNADYICLDDFLMCHYPLEDETEISSHRIGNKILLLKKVFQEKELKCVLHGHCHMTQKDMIDGRPHYNVSCDLSGYYPTDFEDIKARFSSMRGKHD